MENNVAHDMDNVDSLRTRRALLAKVASGLALTASGLFLPAIQAETAAKGKQGRGRRKNDKGHQGGKGRGNGCVWKGNGIQITVINGFSEQDVPGSFDGEFWEIKHKFKKERCYYSHKKVEAFTMAAGTTATEPVILQTDLHEARIQFPDRDELTIWVMRDPMWVGTLNRQQDAFSPAEKITEEGLSLIDDSDGAERKFTLRKGPELADYNHFILEIGPTSS